MQYCKNFTSFHDLDIITQVTIPAKLSTDLLIRLSELTFKNGGKVLEFGSSEDENAIFFFKFLDDTSRNKFCDEVETFVDLLIHKVSFTPIIDANGNQTLKIVIDMKFALEELQTLIEESSPVVNFIESNGGFEPEENLLEGFFALEDALSNHTLSKEVENSLNFVLTFMGAYTIASETLESINKIEPGKQSARLNALVSYHRFQIVMEELKPIIVFIESHGGWADKKTGKFEGFDSFEEAKSENTLNEEVKKAIEILTKLIAGYTLGKRALISSTIVRHEETN